MSMAASEQEFSREIFLLERSSYRSLISTEVLKIYRDRVLSVYGVFRDICRSNSLLSFKREL